MQSRGKTTVPVALALEFGGIPLLIEAAVTLPPRENPLAHRDEPPAEPEIAVHEIVVGTADDPIRRVELDPVTLEVLFETAAPGITRSLRDAVMQRAVEEASR